MSKTILFGDEARLQMFSGMEKVAKTVTATIGPKGRNVIFAKSYGAPQVTNDGVTIAKEIELEDPIENMGAELIKEAASRTNDAAGDGTTTATLLTYAMVKEGLREIRSGINAIELKNGMKKAGDLIEAELAKNSKKISTGEEITQIATISAQDREVGEIISQAMSKVGNDGVITVEEGQTFGLEVELTEGMKFDTGYVSPYMVTDAEKMESRIADAHILITDKKISSLKDLLPVLEQLAGTGKRDLVIIAEDVEGDALAGIILNKLKGVLNVLAIKSPGFGDRKKEMLKDIAVLTGATVITDELGYKLEHASMEHLGRAKTVIAKKDNTTIIGGGGDKSRITARTNEIRAQIENTKSEYDREKLAERLAKLAGGIAVIKVGAASEVEMKEKKLRIEDALNATKAAVDEGIVAGGGVALLKASMVLENVKLGNKDQEVGAHIVARALSYPVKQIAENAGKEGAIVVDAIRKNSDVNYGYDAATDTFVDMIKTGIIDPKKVARAALENAISIAGMFLTTEALIAPAPGKEESAHDHPGGGMGGMGGMGMY
ncbi:MAG: chaperonin GroEL [Candidatus Gracilibacteria bacterium]|nr:chaperonin GroEL [Candidatus Gracilibacteria bacterium]